MKLLLGFTARLIAYLPGLAQRYQLPEINVITAEGKPTVGEATSWVWAKE